MAQKDNITLSVNRNWVFVFAFILLIAGVALLFARNKGFSSGTSSVQPQTSQSPAGQTVSQSNWKEFENKQYNISFAYPPSWSINQASQVFENGDLVAVQFTGATQEEQTEFYDGARFVVMVPQATSLDLNSWVNSKHSSNVSGTPAQISNTTINGVSFKKVYECGLGCFTYYYTIAGGQIYGVLVSADGPQKVELEATTNQILKTLVITQ